MFVSLQSCQNKGFLISYIKQSRLEIVSVSHPALHFSTSDFLCEDLTECVSFDAWTTTKEHLFAERRSLFFFPPSVWEGGLGGSTLQIRSIIASSTAYAIHLCSWDTYRLEPPETASPPLHCPHFHSSHSHISRPPHPAFPHHSLFALRSVVCRHLVERAFHQGQINIIPLHTSSARDALGTAGRDAGSKTARLGTRWLSVCVCVFYVDIFRVNINTLFVCFTGAAKAGLISVKLRVRLKFSLLGRNS